MIFAAKMKELLALPLTADTRRSLQALVGDVKSDNLEMAVQVLDILAAAAQLAAMEKRAVDVCVAPWKEFVEQQREVQTQLLWWVGILDTTRHLQRWCAEAHPDAAAVARLRTPGAILSSALTRLSELQRSIDMRATSMASFFAM